MGERREAAECLELLIKKLMHGSEADMVETLAERDLSFLQVRALFTLAKAGTALAINELAAAIGQSVATAGRNVDSLVKLELLERAENPADRRVKLVSLASAGRALVDRRIEQQRKALRGFIDSLPAEQARRLLEALRPIVAGFGNQCLSTQLKVSDPHV